MASGALSYGALAERVLSSPRKLTIAHSCKVFSRRRFSLSASSSSSSSSSSEVHHLQSPPPPSISPTHFFSSTAPEPLPPVSPIHQQWHLTDRHLFLLTTIACVTGGAVTALFVAAIPTLLALKKAAESLEKLLEVTREELPGTMAAVRLSGMEISDLTMELSELGQEISSGVKSSARAVRAAQDGLRRVSSIASMAFLQEQRALKAGSTKPAVGVGMAVAIRGLHERLTETRMMLRSVSTLKHILGWIGKLWRVRRRQLQTQTTSFHVS